MPKESKLVVNFKLASLLKEKGVSQRQLSRDTGIRFPSVSEMSLNKTARLPLDNLAIICEYLNCEITDVIELAKK